MRRRLNTTTTVVKIDPRPHHFASRNTAEWEEGGRSSVVHDRLGYPPSAPPISGQINLTGMTVVVVLVLFATQDSMLPLDGAVPPSSTLPVDSTVKKSPTWIEVVDSVIGIFDT